MYKQVAVVLKRAWLNPFRTKSNYARQYANEIAIAASLGLITTKVGKDKFDRMWRITRKGLDYVD